jgi:tetratricopeptide (TPR) repeat protein/class 3 adenylate cyclase
LLAPRRRANVTPIPREPSGPRDALKDGSRKGPLQELMRRRVPGVAFAYLVTAWVVWQVVDIAAPALGLPDWTITFVILATVVGFPVALVLAWAYDVTPQGVVKTAPASVPSDPEEPGDPAAAWKRVEEALHEALEVPDEERALHMQRLQARDEALHDEVASLLEAHDAAGPIDALKDWVAETPLDARLEPGTMVAQYRLTKYLGGGGMGVVYQARDTRLDRTVALKFLGAHVGGDRAAHERFLVEARSAAALDHPNICTVLEVGETGAGRPYIVTPYYDGEPLKARIARGPMEIAEALDVALQVTRGLEAAHRQGIVHRDIKPANVMITSNGVAKIVDFGIAKMTDVALTRTGSQIGTLSYMSPEQALGDQVDHRTDLWSVGVMLHEMLTGRRPFTGSTEQAVRKAILRSGPERLPNVGSPETSALEAILDRALAKERDHRYATAAELATDLEAAIAHGDVGARVVEGGTLVPGGERRICTSLVSFVGGFDRLLEEVGPEQFEEIGRRIEAVAREVVVAEGGRLRDFEGSRLRAVFGIPVANEDDCARAVRTALALRDRVAAIGDELVSSAGHGLAVASGLDTGQVATVAYDGESGYRLSGRALSVSEELARRAEPGTVQLSGESRRLVGGLFATSDGEDVAVAGEERPVSAHVLLGESAEETTGGSRGGERRISAFTGRLEETAAVRAAASRTLLGEGQFVEISGEPGMGKSRMLHELVHGPGAWRFRILFGRCSTVSKSQAYGPFIDLMRDLLEGDAGQLDPDSVVRGILALDPALSETLPYVLQLLSLEHDGHPFPKQQGEQQRAAMVEALAGVLSVLSTKKPLALLLEDWHWADEASKSALLRLLEIVPAFPLIVLVTYRPGYRVEFKGTPNTTTVALGPVDSTTSVALFRAALRAKRLSPELAELVVKRIGGNPFFIEEMAASLSEDGTVVIHEGRASLAEHDALRLPDTVHAVIRARLDRIDPEARSVLLKASVIGHEFPRSLLAELADDETDLDRALGTLKKVGLVQQTKVLPEPEYRFKHALTLEVTYESLLAHHRRELHRKVGELLESRSASQEESLDRLAYHFGQAGEWTKAVSYGFQAAKRAAFLSENGQANLILERVERWAARLESSLEVDQLRIQILFERERVHDLIGQRSAQREAIERLRPLVADAGTEADRIELALREADLLTSTRNYDTAEPILLDAMDRSEVLGDALLRRKVLRSRGMHLWHQGRSAEALEILEETVEIDRAYEDADAEIVDLQNIVRLYRALDRHEEALGMALELYAIAESSEDPLSVGYAANLLGLCHAALGQVDRALELFEETCDELRQGGYLVQGAFSFNSLAHLYLQAGRIDDAVATYRESIEYARRSRDDQGLAQALHAGATLLLGLGEVDQAIDYLTEAAPIFGQLEDHESQLAVTAQLGKLYDQTSRPGDAMAAWASARQWARDLGDLDQEVAAIEGLAGATRKQVTDPLAAVPYYEEALGKARELGDQKVIGRLLNTLGVIAWDRGSYRQAADYYERSLTALREAGESEGVGLALASLGATWAKLGEAARARYHVLEAVDTSRDGRHRKVAGYALALLGDLELDAGQLDAAEAAFRESLELRRALRDERGEGWMLFKLSQVENRRGALDRVRDLASQAYGIASRVGDQALLEACTAQERF